MAGLKGFKNVTKNLNREIGKIKNRSFESLIESAILIRRSMEETPPLIPLDLGNLRASWFTSPVVFGRVKALLIGFTALYAPFVHELVAPTKIGEDINWSRPGSGPKFFQASINRNRKMILLIMAKKAKIR